MHLFDQVLHHTHRNCPGFPDLSWTFHSKPAPAQCNNSTGGAKRWNIRHVRRMCRAREQRRARCVEAAVQSTASPLQTELLTNGHGSATQAAQNTEDLPREPVSARSGELLVLNAITLGTVMGCVAFLLHHFAGTLREVLYLAVFQGYPSSSRIMPRDMSPLACQQFPWLMACLVDGSRQAGGQRGGGAAGVPAAARLAGPLQAGGRLRIHPPGGGAPAAGLPAHRRVTGLPTCPRSDGAQHG